MVDVDLEAEERWVKSLKVYMGDYSEALQGSVDRYVERVISAYKVSPELGRRTSDNYSGNIASESLSEITKAIATAYMSGKNRANKTLPISKVPRVGFRMGDMDSINRLRDFSHDEVRKLINDFKIMVKLRTLERRDYEQVTEAIKEDYGHTRGKVERLSRTEVMRAANTGRFEEYAYHRVSEVVWVTIGEGCQRCRELDGKLFFLSQLPSAPLHLNCKCTFIATR